MLSPLQVVAGAVQCLASLARLRLASLALACFFPPLQVVAGAVQCLASLARLRPEHATRALCHLASSSHARLEQGLAAPMPPLHPHTAPQQVQQRQAQTGGMYHKYV